MSDIAKAKELLQDTDKTVSAIAEETGAKYNTIYYHAKRLRDADAEKKEKDSDLKSTIQDQMEESYNELKAYAAELEAKIKSKDELIERLQSQAPQNEEDDIWEKRPSVDWKAQHDDLLEKFEELQTQKERMRTHYQKDATNYQHQIDHLTKQLQTEQERANYHGKRDHHLTEIVKLG